MVMQPTRQREGERNRTSLSMIAVKGLADIRPLQRMTGLMAPLGVVAAYMNAERAGNYPLTNIEVSQDSSVRIDFPVGKLRASAMVKRVDLVAG